MINIRPSNLRYLIIALISFMCLNNNGAQNIDDALRFSQLSIQGTATSMSTGNAFNALGADFTASSMNPAGIGGFKKSYFILTPGYVSNDTKSILNEEDGNVYSESKWNINNIGLVFSSNNPNSEWTQSNIAIGLNRLANYNETFYYEGKSEGSITERFIEKANSKSLDDLDDFEAYPAYAVGAIYDDPISNNQYISDIQHLSTQVQKNQLVRRTGGMTEFALAWGGSYNNKLNVGFGVGIPFISFEEVKTYNETDINDEISNFTSLYYKEYLSTSGTGLNLKAGINYKVANALRLGFNIQSPTWMILKDEYYTDIEYSYSQEHEDFTFSEESPIGEFKYKMATPWSMTGSIGTLFKSGKWKGFLNLDVDVKDYANNRFNLSVFNNSEEEVRFEDELNDEVDTQLGLGVSYRLGGEIAYEKLRLRLGYALIASPYSIDKSSAAKNVYSIGTGFRFGNMYLDFAYQISNKEEGYIPYLVLDDTRNQLVQNTTTLKNGAITLGFNF